MVPSEESTPQLKREWRPEAPSSFRGYRYRFQREVVSKLSGEVLDEVRLQGEVSLVIKSPTEWLLTQESGGTVQYLPETGEVFSEIGVKAENLQLLCDLGSLLHFESKKDPTGTYESQISEAQLNRRKTHAVRRKRKTKYLGFPEGHEPRLLLSRHEEARDLQRPEVPARLRGQDHLEIAWGENEKMLVELSYSIQLIEEKMQVLKERIAFESLDLQDPKLNELRELKWGRTAEARALRLKELLGSWGSLTTMTQTARMNDFGKWLELLRAEREFGGGTEEAYLTFLKLWKRDQQSSSELLTFGVGVLATFAGPKAEHELVEFYRKEEIPAHREAVLTSLATTEAPLNPETQAFLASLATADLGKTELTDGAALALGASLERAPSSEGEGVLLGLLDGAQNPTQQATYLDAIGNSGRVTMVESVERFLESESEDLRARAVYALRSMADPRVPRWIGDALQDSSESVRLSAFRALVYREEKNQFSNEIHSCIDREEGALQAACQRLVAAMETGARYEDAL
jgi:hypothetical protein